MTKQKTISYTTIITLGIIGILLLSPSVMSQPINISGILPKNISIVAYLSIGIVGFLWGVSTKFFH